MMALYLKKRKQQLAFGLVAAALFNMEIPTSNSQYYPPNNEIVKLQINVVVVGEDAHGLL